MVNVYLDEASNRQVGTLKYLINEHEKKYLIKEHCGILKKKNKRTFWNASNKRTCWNPILKKQTNIVELTNIIKEGPQPKGPSQKGPSPNVFKHFSIVIKQFLTGLVLLVCLLYSQTFLQGPCTGQRHLLSGGVAKKSE